MIPYDDKTTKFLITMMPHLDKMLIKEAFKYFFRVSTLEDCDLGSKWQDLKGKCFVLGLDDFNYVNHGDDDKSNVGSPDASNKEVSSAAYVALKDIESGEEILVNYGRFDESDQLLLAVKRKIGLTFEADLYQ